MMCELRPTQSWPSSFLELFDGFSIGSNDLTQLTLGLDAIPGWWRELRRARPGREAFLEMAINACRKHGKYVGICGRGRPTIRSRALADGAGHRQPVPQPGYGGDHLACVGGEFFKKQTAVSGLRRSAASRGSSPCRARRGLSCFSLPLARPISSLMRPLL